MGAALAAAQQDRSSQKCLSKSSIFAEQMVFILKAVNDMDLDAACMHRMCCMLRRVAGRSSLTGVHCGPSGQSPQEHLSAESQQGGTVSLAATMPLGVSGSPGKLIWKGEPVGGTLLSFTVPRNSKNSPKFWAPPPMKLMAFRLAAAYTTSCT